MAFGNLQANEYGTSGGESCRFFSFTSFSLSTAAIAEGAGV
jgi:hypothetical protein